MCHSLRDFWHERSCCSSRARSCAICTLQFVICALQSAICTRQYSICNLHWRNLQSAICHQNLHTPICNLHWFYLHIAHCNLQSAICILYTVICNLQSALMQSAHSNLYTATMQTKKLKPNWLRRQRSFAWYLHICCKRVPYIRMRNIIWRWWVQIFSWESICIWKFSNSLEIFKNV